MSRIRWVVGIAGAVVALAGCWPVSGQNPDRTAHNAFESRITPATVGELTRAWVAAAPWAADFPGAQLGVAVTDPVVSAHGVHAVYGGCAIGTYRPSDGTLSWGGAGAAETCFQLGPQYVEDYSPPLVAGPAVAFGWTGSYDTSSSPPPPVRLGGTHEFDTETGAVPAEPVIPGAIPAAVRGDTVVSTSPREVWVQVPPFPAVQVWVGNAQITIGSLTDASDRRTFATDGDTRPTLGPNAIFQSGDGSLATTPGDATVGAGVRAYSSTEARPGCGPADNLVECPLWAAPTDGFATVPVIAPDQGTVYVGTAAGTVYALDAASGAVQWTSALGSAIPSPPALADGTLFVPTANGRLVALAAAGCGAPTCAPQWEASTGSRIGVQPAVAGGVVFTGSDDGSVDAFVAAGCGAATCPALWSAETGSRITGAPAVSNGQLYVGTADERLIAYRRP